MPGPRFAALPDSGDLVLRGDWMGERCIREGTLCPAGSGLVRTLRSHPRVTGAIGRGRVALDVGAFFGTATRILLARGCVTWAFEPNPDALRCLESNCPGAHIVDAIVGDGQVTAALRPDVHASSAYALTDASGRQTLALDELPLRRCDLVKIDVEGFEPFVLAGMRSILERFRPVLFVEVNPPALRRQGFSGDLTAITSLLPSYYEWEVATHPEHAASPSWQPWDVVFYSAPAWP